MSMATRCPSCGTLFRVTAEQLRAHHGQVRCGRCIAVFDGFKGLAALPEERPGDTPPQRAEETASFTDREATAARSEAPVAQAAAAEAVRDFTPTPELPAGFESAPIEPTLGVATRASAEAASRAAMADAEDRARMRPGLADAPSSIVRGDPSFLEQARSVRRGDARIWMAGSLLMLLVLTGQAVFFYRGELAARHPGLRPVFTQFCTAFGCSVPLPQRPGLVRIEASDLQSVDPARPGVIQLAVTLRNYAGHHVAYPALDLVLTDTREHTLARRIFQPGEYLGQGNDAATGFPASAEITVRLDLDTGELGATGFRLGLLPAPAH